MPKRIHPTGLFDRFRRASPLRVIFVVAALLASQSSMACAFDEAPPQEIEYAAGVAESPDGSGDDCFSLCFECASCGGCCSVAVNLRGSDAQPAFAAIDRMLITSATTAPKLWTPPALLRPPITAA
jgi:hypothetical protein